jgi:hypothetical protein
MYLKYIYNSFNFNKTIFQYYFRSIPKNIFILKFFIAPIASFYNPYWRNALTLTSKAFTLHKIMVQCLDMSHMHIVIFWQIQHTNVE